VDNPFVAPPPDSQSRPIVAMQLDPLELGHMFACVQLAESKAAACPHAEMIATNTVTMTSAHLGRVRIKALLDRMHACAVEMAKVPA
jgi:hypothetical protein